MLRHILLFVCFLLTSNILLSQTGTVTTIISGESSYIRDALSVDKEGNIYSSIYGNNLHKISPPPELEVTLLSSNFANNVCSEVDSKGNVYVSDFSRNLIRVITPEGEDRIFASNITTSAGIAFDKDDNLFVASFGTNTIYKISNEGSSKQVVTSGGGISNPVDLDFDENGILYSSNFNNGRIFKITLDDSFNAASVEFLAQVPQGANPNWAIGYSAYNRGYIYATGIGTDRIYRVSTDTGELEVFAGNGQRTTVDGDLQNCSFVRPNGIAFTQSGDTCYVSEGGTTANNLRMIVFSEDVTDVGSVDELPTKIKLNQNYPNPFNPSTVISYQLSDASDVKLKIYDILGKEIKTLVNGRKYPGKYEVTFDASNLSNGVYIYELIAGEYSFRKKMTLIK